MSQHFRILRVNWAESGQICANVREKVFVYEMRIAADVESDGQDGYCEHVLALSDEGEAIGSGRIQKNGEIDRIAVLMPWRQHGVGSALLDELIAIARDRLLGEVLISAPLFAVEFYRLHQFESTGQVYMYAGIPHQRMCLSLGLTGSHNYLPNSLAHAS